MKKLFDLISTYSQDNSIMPIIALISIFVVILIYVFIKKKWAKYLVTGIVIIVGAVMMFSGYRNMLQSSGLEMIILAAKVLLFGAVGFLFSIILDILDSLFRMFKKPKNNKTKNNSKADKFSFFNSKKEENKINNKGKTDSQTKIIDSKEIKSDVNDKETKRIKNVNNTEKVSRETKRVVLKDNKNK